MIEDGITPKQISKNTFESPSSSGTATYTVSGYAHNWRCSCPDHQYRHVVC
ncbi:hypothetical protein [Methanothrix soehngenii]